MIGAEKPKRVFEGESQRPEVPVLARLGCWRLNAEGNRCEVGTLTMRQDRRTEFVANRWMDCEPGAEVAQFVTPDVVVWSTGAVHFGDDTVRRFSHVDVIATKPRLTFQTDRKRVSTFGRDWPWSGGNEREASLSYAYGFGRGKVVLVPDERSATSGGIWDATVDAYDGAAFRSDPSLRCRQDCDASARFSMVLVCSRHTVAALYMEGGREVRSTVYEIPGRARCKAMSGMICLSLDGQDLENTQQMRLFAFPTLASGAEGDSSVVSGRDPVPLFEDTLALRADPSTVLFVRRDDSGELRSVGVRVHAPVVDVFGLSRQRRLAGVLTEDRTLLVCDVDLGTVAVRLALQEGIRVCNIADDVLL